MGVVDKMMRHNTKVLTARHEVILSNMCRIMFMEQENKLAVFVICNR